MAFLSINANAPLILIYDIAWSFLCVRFELRSPASTPYATSSKQSLTGSESLSNPAFYWNLMGALQINTPHLLNWYCMPTLSIPFASICMFPMLNSHLVAAERILHHLRGTIDHGIFFSDCRHWPSSTLCFQRCWPGLMILVIIVIPLQCLLSSLGHNPITWLLKKQHIVSRSSTESKYWSFATGVDELAWIHQILKDLGIFLPIPPVFWCDSTSALALAFNPIFHSCTKLWL